MLDPAILPNYPYRDDAIAIFDAIEEYVSTVVNHFYGKKFICILRLSLSVLLYGKIISLLSGLEIP